MSTSRKSHRKTRTGCVSCKQRKVKCDEQKPSCTNCARRFTPCVYLPIGPPSTLATPESSVSQAGSPAAFTPFSAPFSPSLSLYTNTSSNVVSQPNVQPFDMLHLELLHNWSTSTSYTMTPLHNDEYRIEAPKFAFSHDFVMHGIMAVSALHLAYLRHDRQEYYLFHAKAQHEAGLRIASGLISSMNETSCVPLWIFSTLCCVFATARPRTSGDFVIIGEHGQADWFAVVRGCRAILESSHEVLLNSPFGSMFRSGISRGKLRENAVLEKDFLLPLRQRIVESSLDADTAAIYGDTIDELRKCYAVVYGETKAEFSDVFRWLWHTPDEYFQLLQQKTPASLCILAYFAVLLHPFSSYWWIEGFSRHIVTTVYQSLDQDHRSWIRWPIEEVGGISE